MSRDTFKRQLHAAARERERVRAARMAWEISFRHGQVCQPCAGHAGKCWRPAPPGELCERCAAALARANSWGGPTDRRRN
jgi:hypothetical protein